MSKNSAISVIIPTYNRAHFILNALNSILEQSYRPIEILVIDDGSTDDTEEKLTTWNDCNLNSTEATDQSGITFHYLNQLNAGPSAARNRGIRASTGEFIHFMDSDDLIHPQLYSKAISQMQTDQSEICHFGMQFFNDGSPTKLFNRYAPPSAKSLLDGFFKNNLLGFGVGFIRTREHCLKLEPWDIKLRSIAEDRDYCFNSLVLASTYSVINKPLYFVRQHTTGRLNCERRSQTRWEQRLYADSKIARVLQSTPKRFTENQKSRFRAQMFNLGIHMHAMGHHQLSKEYGNLAQSLVFPKQSWAERRLSLVWKTGPIGCKLWQKVRDIKKRTR